MASTTTPSVTSSTSTACITISPGKHGYLPPESCDVILYYVPSFGAAILFCVLYGLVAMLHIFQAIIYKKVGLLFPNSPGRRTLTDTLNSVMLGC